MNRSLRNIIIGTTLIFLPFAVTPTLAAHSEIVCKDDGKAKGDITRVKDWVANWWKNKGLSTRQMVIEGELFRVIKQYYDSTPPTTKILDADYLWLNFSNNQVIISHVKGHCVLENTALSVQGWLQYLNKAQNYDRVKNGQADGS